jgi:lysophospholipase L1-like esterase
MLPARALLYDVMTSRLAVLGDSIGYGIGASRRADTLAPRLAADLAPHPVETHVVAVPGARSADLAAQVPRAVRWSPTVALIVIGANDLTALVPPDRAAAALGAAVRELRSVGAQVVVAPAPDMSIVPHVPVAMRGIVRAGSAMLRKAQVAAVLAEGGRVGDVDADTAKVFAGDPAMFSRDRFHPSSQGYAVIAEALLPAVRAAIAERADLAS